jgi:anti-sigma-K factor RskA
VSTHEQYAEDVVLYALGSLDAGEKQAFEAHLQQCAACRRELQAVQEDLGVMALSTAGPKPPVRSRDRLVAAMANEPKRIQRPQAVGKGWMWIPWFVALAFALLSALQYFSNLRVKNESAAIRANAQEQEIQLRQSREMLELLKSPDAMRVTLVPGNEKPKPQGKTIYSPKMGKMIFMVSNLPPAPPNKAYQLWVMPKQGAPIPAGTFWPDATGNATMMHTSMPSGMEPKGFAVTMEKAEGSTTPSMPILMAGNAGE